jgi:hypothetical protein
MITLTNPKQTDSKVLKVVIGQKAMYPELLIKMSKDKDNKEEMMNVFARSLTDEEFTFLVYEILAKGKVLKDAKASAKFKTVDEELDYILGKMPSLLEHKEELRINLVSYRRKFGLNT